MGKLVIVPQATLSSTHPKVIVPSMPGSTTVSEHKMDREIHQKKMNFVCKDIASLFKKSCPEPAVSSDVIIDDSEFDFCEDSDDEVSCAWPVSTDSSDEMPSLCEFNPLKRNFAVSLGEIQNAKCALRSTNRFVEEIETRVSKASAYENALREVTKRRKYFHPVEIPS